MEACHIKFTTEHFYNASTMAKNFQIFSLSHFYRYYKLLVVVEYAKRICKRVVVQLRKFGTYCIHSYCMRHMCNKRNLRTFSILFNDQDALSGQQPGFSLLSFRPEMGKPTPLEPEKIERYLVLSAQKSQKIGGQKNLPPKKPFSGRFTRGIRKKVLNPKYLVN